MLYYIKTNKELTYELSEPFSTREEAQLKIDKMHKKKKYKSEIVVLPSSIRDGLKLYKSNNEYYCTIVGSSDTLWFLQADISKNEVLTPLRKQKLIDWYVSELLIPKEEYNDNIEFKDIKSIGECDIGDNDNLKEEE